MEASLSRLGPKLALHDLLLLLHNLLLLEKVWLLRWLVKRIGGWVLRGNSVNVERWLLLGVLLNDLVLFIVDVHDFLFL